MIVDQRRVSFRWGDSTRNGLPIYPWRFAHGTVNVAITPPDAVLRHEIGHDLLQRYVVPSTRSGQYGTDAPDWMDEAVAVAFESPEDQSTRRCDAAMLRKSGKLLPIKRFLTMTHPDLAAMQHPAPGASSAAGFVYDPTASIDTPAFYAMSIAVPEYFSARTHDQHWLADIIGAYRAGVRLNPATLLGGEVDDNEINTDEVDRNFVSWLARDARYRCVRARIAKSGYRR